MDRRTVCILALLGAAPLAAASAGCGGTSCGAVALEEEEDAGASTYLLQRRGGEALQKQQPALAAIDAGSQRQRLERARPVAWLHVPKCGSSLENFMIHLPGLCPFVPDELVISSETLGDHHNLAFKRLFDPLGEAGAGACPGSFATWGNHHGAGELWDSVYKGHAFVMLRTPEQRILSGYHYGLHSWPGDSPPRDELEYAQGVQGCAVRMMTRGGAKPYETCGGKFTGPPTEAEVQLAIQRIRTDCAFVGITEQWPFAMCLGHRMFGGPCRLSDFVDGRVTDRTDDKTDTAKITMSTELYDETPLHGFKDPYDGPLYQAALEVFQQRLLLYNVSTASCQSCFEEAGVAVDL